jgi:RNA polymerase sigma-B factor
VQFSTFATITITGELKRHLRDKGWAVRVPRPIQELAVRVNRLISELTQELGRSPTVREIANRAGATEEDTLEAMEAARAYSAESLDAPSGVEERTPGERLAETDERLDRLEAWQTIAPAVRTLPERERTILYLRFSQMHVSRLLSRSLDTIRERAGS